MDISHQLYVARTNVDLFFLSGKQKEPGNSSIICNHLMEWQKIQANFIFSITDGMFVVPNTSKFLELTKGSWQHLLQNKTSPCQ